jgi:hypothetical protein
MIILKRAVRLNKKASIKLKINCQNKTINTKIMVFFQKMLTPVPPTSNGAQGNSREIWVFHSPSWPQQCSPLSTVFDLVKAADEEHTGGPIVVVDR